MEEIQVNAFVWVHGIMKQEENNHSLLKMEKKRPHFAPT